MMGDDHPQAESAGERGEERRSNGVNVQYVRAFEGGSQDTEESMDEGFDAGDARRPDTRESNVAPGRGAALLDVAAAHDRLHAASNFSERAGKLFGVLFSAALHVGKSADAQHGDAQRTRPPMFHERRVDDFVHRTRAESLP